jgi:drug/metabolite transporter (DMT)-like permease
VHGLRSLFGLTAMTSWFTAVSLMPVADATAFTFTAPLFATLGAALVLKETVGPRRWAAVGVGFLGMLVILRPGAGALEGAAFVALAAALFMAAAKLTVKSLSRTEMPDTIVLYMGLFMTPVSLVPALFVWQWPSWTALAWLVLVGGLASVAQRAMARSFAAADASAVMPLDFSRLIFAAALGWLVFGEAPDAWTWAGAGVIFAATWYTARREAALRSKMD